MTADLLVRAVRSHFIEEARAERFWRKMPRARRAEYAAAGRRIRARRRVLLTSESFRSLAQGFVAAGDPDELALARIVAWLAVLPQIANGNVTPKGLAALARKQELMRCEHVRTLRAIAAGVTSKYRGPLNELADEIEADILALESTEIGIWMMGDPQNIGTRGGASDSVGAWRGWIIRELRARLQYFDCTPTPFATMAHLLKWAGIEGVTPTLVRSVLARGRT